MKDHINWDSAAADYQRTFKLGLNDYNRALVQFWEETEMVFPGCRVIDIGCGVGKYGPYFASMGCDVTLTDVSEEMLKHARENMEGFDTPWRVSACDFREATGREAVFQEGFDLAISTMSPAICDAQTLRKMSEMTQGWCFLARFAAWSQPGRDALLRALRLTPGRQGRKLEDDCAAMLRLAAEAGYAPQVKTVDYDWCDLRTPEEMAAYLLTRLASEGAPTPERAAAVEAARRLSRADGLFEDAIRTKVAWIYWETGRSKAHDKREL